MTTTFSPLKYKKNLYQIFNMILNNVSERGPTYLTGGFPAPPELAVLEAFPGDGVTGRSVLTVTGVLTQVAEKSHRARPWK